MKRISALFALLLLLATGCEARESRAVADETEPTAAIETEPESEPAETEPEAVETAPETQSPDAEGAKSAAEELLAALQTGEPDAIREHIDYSNLLLLDEGAPEPSLLAILKKLDYEITDVNAEQTAAEVTATLSNVGIAGFFAEYLQACMKLEYDFKILHEGEQITDAELTAELEEQYQQAFYDSLDENEANRVEAEVVIRLSKTGDTWRARVSEELRDAATGGYFSAREATGMNPGV